jgi:hypothetical protein
MIILIGDIKNIITVAENVLALTVISKFWQ